MSNVLYVCANEKCQGRLFAAPGGTKLKCRHHPDDGYVQAEEYNGPDYLNIDEQGKTKSRDIVGPGNERLGHDDGSPEAVMNRLREDYRRESRGLVADKRWGEARLKDEIAAVIVENERVAAEETEKERLAAEEGGDNNESSSDHPTSNVSDSPDLGSEPEVTDSEVIIIEQDDVPELEDA